MAHKVFNKDMAELVSALKLAERYSNTTLDNKYRKNSRTRLSAGCSAADNTYQISSS
ncbi:hypothetical protein DAPPUDRAFT_311214 [Daphnia pulex]|uniref:Focal AT domain-containing protein n=1 Tax=Daphnia pulex TaxID=6669 RepID=E9FV06_DAPPU|nr:hypothetical protein DAPPUDRAFT_311214 [Daphnia pulex]|eukprot:EFX88815.1 hypothetical protein DAPPUDRAFT_311214 [Daphnia pulex]